MPVLQFPDPEEATHDGIVAIGGDLHPDSLRLAYSQGIFPWPHEGMPLLWFSPPERAILDFSLLHVPRRLARTRRSSGLRFTIDAAFDEVISACQQSPRTGQEGTWITKKLKAAYCMAHRLGFVHSVEAWSSAGDLVGGLYGVDGGGIFAGESMFYRESDASKLALLFLVEHLAMRGATFMDIQMMTPHMKALGAVEVPRHQFLKRLSSEKARGLTLFDTSADPGSRKEGVSGGEIPALPSARRDDPPRP
ncbi:MAG: leucyl/phenylalanyl-tRNA--protein transferase [Cytophagales bacterium]|nr:leucyl/phenylalanyl-tRNA--protein transferase [Armatimonadota bacterium]